MYTCFSCKKEIKVFGKPGRMEVCPSCGADLKVCLNCKFYGEGAYHQCRETNAEWVKEKDKANFCEYFEFKESESECPSQKERVEEMWKGLFKKSRG